MNKVRSRFAVSRPWVDLDPKNERQVNFANSFRLKVISKGSIETKALLKLGLY